MSEREATEERNHALVGLEEDLSQTRLAERVVLEIEPVRVERSINRRHVASRFGRAHLSNPGV